MAELATNNIPNLHGNWKFIRQENFDEFLSENGVGWMKRKVASAIKPSMNIRQDASHYHIEVSAKITTKVWDFNVGDSFEEQGELNKITCMVSTKIEDGKLVMEFVPKNQGEGKTVRQTRHIENGELILTLIAGDVIAKRYFEKVA